MLRRLSLALILAPCLSTADPLTLQRVIQLHSELVGFGGLSAIEMQRPDSAIVLSDRGQAFALSFDPETRIPSIARFPQPRPERDSEGLAYAAKRLFFSYENPGEVVRQSGISVQSHPDFEALALNGALEALAGTPDGTLYAIPERSLVEAEPFPIYRYLGGRWDITAHLPRNDPFRPVGADVGPDRLLYVLERSFSPLGFRTQIRRIDLNTKPPQIETLLRTTLGTHDNLEGLAIWVSGSGATCLTMVSDNNFLSIQANEIVEYALTETLAGGATCE